MKKRVVSLMLAAAFALSALAGCGNSDTAKEDTAKDVVKESAEEETAGTENITEDGSITLTMAFHYDEDFYETNIVPMIENFKQLHPEVADITYTSLRGVTDEQQITKLTGGQFEDITLVPQILLASEYSNYFTPVGTVEEMAERYYYGDFMQYEGESYGVPIGVVFEGIVYNKKLVDKYCGGGFPTTLDGLLEACETMSADGVTPFWTNAGSVWPMRYWDNLAITMSDDPDYANTIVATEEPWAEGTYLRQVEDLLADMAAKGWLEEDPVTADQFDLSVTSLAMGETAFMLTGTWALPEAKKSAEEAGFSADDIGFAPFPYKNDVSSDNKLKLRIAQDLFMGVNKNSEHVELATEWCKFFCERVSLPVGMNEVLIDGGKNQPDLEFIQDLDYVEVYTSPAKDARINEMASAAGIDVYSFDGFLLDYVILPVLNGEEPRYDELNKLWGRNFE